jgi:Ca-activated chloride channel family protein
MKRLVLPLLLTGCALPTAAMMAMQTSRLAEPGVDTEAYDRIDENQFHAVVDHPLSTFSIDVDTASYANVRRYLRDGGLPPKDAVRIEELVNYFRYDYPEPKGDSPFGTRVEIGPCPWERSHLLAHIGLRTHKIDDAQAPRRNLVFLIDVSGSMNMLNKLPLLKRALALLVEQLRETDRVALVVYAGNSGLVLPPTSGSDKARIMEAIGRLEAGGSTNGASGIRLAYEVAAKSFIRGGVNRVILATDGDFNVGVSSQGGLTRLIEHERQSGVFLSVLGFGMGNLKDANMEKLADRGNGNYAYIDTLAEARKVLVEEGGATLDTVAKDVKIQVEMNPARIASYRLIGYENRLLREEQFNDDKADAGEMGAGHTVTALYELVPVGVAGPDVPWVDALKYQSARKPAASHELMTIKVRYKEPDGDVSKLLSWSVTDVVQGLERTSESFRFAAAVAGFGMVLRDSANKEAANYELVAALARGSLGADAAGYRHELLALIEAARRLQ